MLYFTIFFFQQYNGHMKLRTFPLRTYQFWSLLANFIYGQCDVRNRYGAEVTTNHLRNQSIPGTASEKLCLLRLLPIILVSFLSEQIMNKYWRHKTEQGRDSGGVKSISVRYNIGYNDVCLSTLLLPDCLQDFSRVSFLRRCVLS